MPDVVSALERALDGLVDAVAGVAPGWLVLGVLLHLSNQVARGVGWHAVVGGAGDGAARPRKRHVIAAWVAGAGAGGVVSARGGDAVRVLVLARRMPGTGTRALLTGTLVAEGVGETVLGVVTLLLAVALGVHAAPDATIALYAAAAITALAAAAWLARRHPRTRAFAQRVRCGCTALKHPQTYARKVIPYQLASRLLRFAALGCFLAAFHLPATPAAILLVTFAQCSGRILPFSPASAAAGTAILAATFQPVTGASVPTADLAAFFVGTSTVLTIVGSSLALVLCATQANVRPRLWTRTRIRAAAAPSK